MKWYRQFLAQAPLDLSPFVHLGTVPSSDPFPKGIWGKKTCALVVCYTGPLERAEEAVRPIRQRAAPAHARLGGAHAVPGPAKPVRPAAPQGPAVVLERRLRQGVARPGDRAAC